MLQLQPTPARTTLGSRNPFQLICHKFGADLAVPNVTGIGDVLMYTRLVEEVAMRYGRPLNLLTGPIQPVDGVRTVDNEEPFPIWRGNPFVGKILDLAELSPESMALINASHERHCHFGHIISNICAEYGVVPRSVRPSLFLTEDECREALMKLSDLPRPVLCLHPYGTSSPKPAHPWYRDEWHNLLSALSTEVSAVEVGMHGREDKGLPTKRFCTTLREMMALVWASDMFMGFDSSVAHVATAFCKPAMVLWDPIRKSEIDTEPGMGPAAFARWSYPQNRNLMLLGESQGEIRRVALNWVRNVTQSIGAQY